MAIIVRELSDDDIRIIKRRYCLVLIQGPQFLFRRYQHAQLAEANLHVILPENEEVQIIRQAHIDQIFRGMETCQDNFEHIMLVSSTDLFFFCRQPQIRIHLYIMNKKIVILMVVDGRLLVKLLDWLHVTHVLVARASLQGVDNIVHKLLLDHLVFHDVRPDALNTVDDYHRVTHGMLYDYAHYLWVVIVKDVPFAAAKEFQEKFCFFVRKSWYVAHCDLLDIVLIILKLIHKRLVNLLPLLIATCELDVIQGPFLKLMTRDGKHDSFSIQNGVLQLECWHLTLQEHVWQYG